MPAACETVIVALPAPLPATVAVVPLIVTVATPVLLEVTDKAPLLGDVTVKVVVLSKPTDMLVFDSVKTGVALAIVHVTLFGLEVPSDHVTLP